MKEKLKAVLAIAAASIFITMFTVFDGIFSIFEERER